MISKVKKWAGISKTSVVNYTEVEGKSFKRFFTFILPLVSTLAFEPLGHKFPHMPVGTHRPHLLPKIKVVKMDFFRDLPGVDYFVVQPLGDLKVCSFLGFDS